MRRETPSASAAFDSDSVSVLLATSTGFATAVSYPTGKAPAGLTLADVNGNYGSTYIGWRDATCRRSNHGYRNRSDRSYRSEA